MSDVSRRTLLKALATVAPVPAVKSLRLSRGDTLVLEYPGKLSAEAASCIETTARRVFPGHRVLVLDGGMTMKVVRG